MGVRASPVPAAELPGGPATASFPTASSTCRYPRPPPALPARPSQPRHDDLLELAADKVPDLRPGRARSRLDEINEEDEDEEEDEEDHSNLDEDSGEEQDSETGPGSADDD